MIKITTQRVDELPECKEKNELIARLNKIKHQMIILIDSCLVFSCTRPLLRTTIIFRIRGTVVRNVDLNTLEATVGRCGCALL